MSSSSVQVSQKVAESVDLQTNGDNMETLKIKKKKSNTV